LPSLGRASDYTMWLRDAGFTLLSCDDLTSRVRPTWTLSTRRLLRRLFTRPSSWAYLLDRRNGNRVFALTVLRILAAYRFGAMRYAMFTAVRGEA
jgi:tocopherol O-methyltransferase